MNSGIAVEVKAVSNLVFPLIETSSKNLIKLYLNVVGILTGVLYGNNIRAVLDDVRSVNLGSVYECVVATELKTRHKKLHYIMTIEIRVRWNFWSMITIVFPCCRSR